MNDYLHLIPQALGETFWPTRCAICDTPGKVLCKRCTTRLPFLNYYFACPTCGAPFGRKICCECNSLTLEHKQLQCFPLNACTSVMIANGQSVQLVTTYKDRGEQRLAKPLATLLAHNIHPTWPKDAPLVAIPATRRARQKRGFDHMELLVKQLSKQSGHPALFCLANAVPHKDQRLLNARERSDNMTHSFSLVPQKSIALKETAILVDDVFTTGATLFAAARTLRKAGVSWVGALTLIRV